MIIFASSFTGLKSIPQTRYHCNCFLFLHFHPCVCPSTKSIADVFQSWYQKQFDVLAPFRDSSSLIVITQLTVHIGRGGEGRGGGGGGERDVGWRRERVPTRENVYLLEPHYLFLEKRIR